MELNTRGRYAVMALADLAAHGGGAALAISAVAERQKISTAYLEQLFGALRRAGLVESARGRLGGYRLARPAGAITIGEIMAAAGEPFEMTRCASQEAAGCVMGERCLTHELWHVLGEHINSFLAKVTLEDVIKGIPEHLRADRSHVRSDSQSALDLPGRAPEITGGLAAE
ncbi:MAG: Rrf2 family transcriptional regulator [Rhizobiales bacterium]|nr:Rrf2 family transcriptional regulator [Hyphomicrobiales bacterium]